MKRVTMCTENKRIQSWKGKRTKNNGKDKRNYFYIVPDNPLIKGLQLSLKRNSLSRSIRYGHLITWMVFVVTKEAICVNSNEWRTSIVAIYLHFIGSLLHMHESIQMKPFFLKIAFLMRIVAVDCVF